MRAAAVVLMVVLSAEGCPPPQPSTPSAPAPTEDTSDETVLQFHEFGQLEYGKWYEAQGNSACRWRIETRKAGTDGPATVLESGTYDDALRVREEKPGRDVFLRFNRACDYFQEAPR